MCAQGSRLEASSSSLLWMLKLLSEVELELVVLLEGELVVLVVVLVVVVDDCGANTRGTRGTLTSVSRVSGSSTTSSWSSS